MVSQDRRVWRTSSYSGTNGGQCVEVAFEAGAVFIRDSKFHRDRSNDHARQPVIELAADDWSGFLASAVDPETEWRHSPRIGRLFSGEVVLHATCGTRLTFTADEWSAFTAGVLDGEFVAA